MKKEAILFLDYNETFDDVCEGKGSVFIAALRRFIKHFDGNVKIVVITSAKHGKANIKDDLAFTMHYFPKLVREKFSYLVEEDCKYLYKININDSRPTFENQQTLSSKSGTKKDGVENVLKVVDPDNKITTCVFAGDSEHKDLIMMDANVGNREKYFLLANKRVLKTDKHPVYKLSMRPQLGQLEYTSEVKEKTGQTENIIIKSSSKSYGVGKALEVVTNLLENKGKNRDK